MTQLDKDGPSVCPVVMLANKISVIALVCDVRDGRYRLDEFSEHDAKTFEQAAAAIRQNIQTNTPKKLPDDEPYLDDEERLTVRKVHTDEL